MGKGVGLTFIVSVDGLDDDRFVICLCLRVLTEMFQYSLAFPLNIFGEMLIFGLTNFGEQVISCFSNT